jgi:AcrR family transcriptional regulator
VAARSATSRPLRQDAQRNHQRVLDAAREVIAERGIDAPMELVAARAGVGIGTVYRRFPSKQALVAELVRIQLDTMEQAAEAALDLGDGTGLESFLSTLGCAFAGQRGYADKLAGQVDAERSEAIREAVERLLAQAQEHGRVRQDITLGDVMAAAWGLRGIIETSGDVAPEAWQRHLGIHLAGMRSADAPSGASVTSAQLAEISGRHAALGADAGDGGTGR